MAVDQLDIQTEFQSRETFTVLAPFADRVSVTERQRVTRDRRLVRRAR